MIDAGPTWKDWAQWFGYALLAMLQFIGLYQIKRIGALEEGKADKTDMRALLDELRDERESADESRALLHEKINFVSSAVARLEGQLDGPRRRR